MRERSCQGSEPYSRQHQKGSGDYGLGWSVNDNWNKHRVIWHSGAMPGSAATLWLVPAEKIAIAVIANQITGPVNHLAGETLAELLPTAQPAAGSRAAEEVKPSTPVLRPLRQRIQPVSIEAGS